MSRKPFIAGNWKMNKNPEEAKAFVEAVASTNAFASSGFLFIFQKKQKHSLKL